MPISNAEHKARELVQEIHRDVQPVSADVETMRAQALAMFQKELDAKIANLQDGETLRITYRVDIETASGEIRGGSGASRNMPEYAEWRKAVYERDNYTCQECGSKRGLNAHHVKQWVSYPALRFDVNNGITLCEECHAKRHPHIGFINGKKSRSPN